jgi:hypothetical protein
MFSDSPEESLTIAGVVSAEWRRQHVLIHARVEFVKGSFIDVESPSQLKRLSEIHETLLKRYGIHSLNIFKIRSQERMVTQRISRTLFEEGEAGVQFRSRLDEKPCFALFEGRAILKPKSAAIPMTMDHPDLIRVCGEYTLVLRPAVV